MAQLSAGDSLVLTFPWGKERILKPAREKKSCHMLKNPSKVSEGFTAEILQTGKECDDMFKVLKFKKLPTKNTLPCKAVLQNERDTAFLSPKKLSDFITTTT